MPFLLFALDAKIKKKNKTMAPADGSSLSKSEIALFAKVRLFLAGDGPYQILQFGSLFAIGIELNPTRSIFCDEFRSGYNRDKFRIEKKIYVHRMFYRRTFVCDLLAYRRCVRVVLFLRFNDSVNKSCKCAFFVFV